MLRPGDDRRRAASATRATSRCGRRAKPGEPYLADAVGPRPTGLAPRVLGDGDEVSRATRSTSTAAASTWCFRTTRTSWRSRARPATGSPATGCTTAWVTLGGEKMSKSLGNTLSVENLLEQVRPPELRYYSAAPHYRSAVDFTAASLDEAATAYRRVEGFVTRAVELAGVGMPEPLTLASFPPAFVDAMNDDIGVPQGLAVLHNTVREGNAALADGDKVRVGAHLRHGHRDAVGARARPSATGSAGGGRGDMRGVIDALVALAIEQRTAARERKDYAAADEIRDQLARAGIIVEDTAAGARWQLRRD